MTKLSPTQQKVLNAMKKDVWYSAYELNASLATLYALRNKRMVEMKSGSGSIAFPRTSIEFRKLDKPSEQRSDRFTWQLADIVIEKGE